MLKKIHESKVAKLNCIHWFRSKLCCMSITLCNAQQKMSKIFWYASKGYNNQGIKWCPKTNVENNFCTVQAVHYTKSHTAKKYHPNWLSTDNFTMQTRVVSMITWSWLGYTNHVMFWLNKASICLLLLRIILCDNDKYDHWLLFLETGTRPCCCM